MMKLDRVMISGSLERVSVVDLSSQGLGEKDKKVVN